jgi:hypothetical protein
VGGADDAAMEAFQGNGAHATTHPDAIGDLGNSADSRVFALVTRHEHDAVLVPDVNRKGDVHAGEDDRVLQRDEQQIGQG